MSIINAIPRQWKQKLHTVGTSEGKRSGLSLLESESTSKKVYNTMVLPIVKENNCLLSLSQKWKTDLNDDNIDVPFMHNSFGKLYAATISTHIRNFQFKLLHRLVATNAKLHRWGIVGNKNCTFCNVEEESYSHLFCKCNHVQAFWQEVFQKIRERSDVQIIFSDCEILLGTPDKIEPIYDLILIIGKMHINHCKYKNCLPSANAFLKRLERVKCIEKYIATKNNCMEAHNKKWSILNENP